MKINNESDLESFMKLQTNHPDQYYICLLSNRKRKLLFKLLTIHQMIILFFPINKKEVIKIINDIIEKKEQIINENKFYNGLKYLNFIWTTREINISATAIYFSHLLRQCKICKNEFEEANTRLGIEEVLINAIEHGNLELNSRYKPSDFKSDNKYDELKKLRYNDPKYNKRKIMIKMEIKREWFFLSIENEGPGFNINKIQPILNGKDQIEDNEIAEPSGKGFWIIKTHFPFIKFENNGRKIILSNKK